MLRCASLASSYLLLCRRRRPLSPYPSQVDNGGWEAEVLLDESQKVRRPRLPVYLDDPDMLFGALHTPRPVLKVLQTEAQQENVSASIGSAVFGWLVDPRLAHFLLRCCC